MGELGFNNCSKTIADVQYAQNYWSCKSETVPHFMSQKGVWAKVHALFAVNSQREETVVRLPTLSRNFVQPNTYMTNMDIPNYLLQQIKRETALPLKQHYEDILIMK